MKTYPSVLPYCRAQTSLSPSVTVSTPYFSRYLQIRKIKKKIWILQSTNRKFKLYIAMIGLWTNPTYQCFPEEGGKTIQWVYWVYLIFHNHTRTLCHKLINLVGTMVQSLRSVWRQVKDTQAIEWKPYIIPYPKPNHIDEFTFKNFLNLVSPNRSCFTISR